ncbi:receptor-like serine/threonine-protein kinase SD1-8 isoform X5 [Olea europaea var. sylvestris]|uniref:receptor-like serine/threonine-protein kinase SD1-8 isoform X2 n=1 Tax=Olea europaea var. sylvestris TaxID=158386 RepID=UPI000C1D4726|nr:receptor-like serine/threonine-protein kinase SD1-8 isoform X2 [Olea europaea var. sylvestris]XP_022860035.1 receptor-like serine/threonine-protein kinase SD1-8 isoform X5 [Olea europaea var. sylvestris]
MRLKKTLLISYSLFLSMHASTAAMIPKNTRCFILSVLFFLCFYININLSLGGDSIRANQSLSGNQTIVSSDGTFELGFFKPGTSSRYYIGIWYKNISPITIVWVANRETTISDMNSAEFKILDENLVLMDESQVSIWSTNVNLTTLNSLVSTLGDNGNLVLRDESEPRTSEGFWQSFDNPTDTLLPGSKLAYDKHTKTKKVLTSWKNSVDPAPGLFHLKLDPNKSQVILSWSRTIWYWTSGSWNGFFFTSVSEMSMNGIYNHFYVDNVNESSYTFSLNNPSLKSAYVLNASGQVTLLLWYKKERQMVWHQPTLQCDVYAYCGAFGTCNQNSCYCLPGFKQRSEYDWRLKDYSGGCVREIILNCTSDRKDKFLANNLVQLPSNSQTVMAGSARECKSICLSNCSCTAYFYEDNACLVWTGELIDLQQSTKNNGSKRMIHIRLSASASQFSNNKKSKVLVIGSVVGSAAVVMVLLATVVIRICHRHKSGTTKAVEGSPLAFRYKDTLQIETKNSSDKLEGDNKSGISVPFCSWESIIAATENFSDIRKLGRGGFGPVYKGTFPGGQEIAVKRLSSCSLQGINEFQNEIVLIAKLQHRNLVRLLGYCMEGNEKILLYEYMPNKSLDAFIFDKKLCMLLNWKKRLDIILGIARGVLYLHQDSRLRIIHRDLKTSNILLDEEMNPKISYFGLARIVEGTGTEASTSKVTGTYGYMSPEYASDGIFSIKSDVFSFGVVVLEIVTGKKNTGFYQSSEDLNLLGYVWRLWSENKALDLVDPILLESCEKSEVIKCINVGLLCVEEDPSDRPTMLNVVLMLSGETVVVPVPNQPAFVMRKRVVSTSSSSSNKPDSISNELTMSDPKGR